MRLRTFPFLFLLILASTSLAQVSQTLESLYFNDAVMGRNGDNVIIYRDDQSSDRAFLKIELGDEYLADFNIGYKRYQDGIWVPLFTLNGSGDGYFANKLQSVGNFIANDLRLGKLGGSLSGDDDPYVIHSNPTSGNHDLIVFGNNAATLNLRLYDGSLKFGKNSDPNTEIFNSGHAKFGGSLEIGGNVRVEGVPTIAGNQIRFSESRGFDYDPDQDAVFYNGYNDGQVAMLSDRSGNGWFKGNVGIGTTTPTHKLEVNGTIRAKEVKVEAAPWPDYVFEEDYDLPTIESIETFIKSNKHLPEVPSAAEVEAEGLKLGEMNALLLKKIEELTLYTIEQEKEIHDLKVSMIKLLNDNEKQQIAIEELKSQNEE